MPLETTDGVELSLAACRQLCEYLGGTFKLESAPGLGSNFHFTLPVQIPPGESQLSLSPSATSLLNTPVPLFKPLAAGDIGARSTPGLLPESLSDIAGARVLLMQTQTNLRQTNCATLSALGIEVDQASDGAECLHQLEHNDYDLVMVEIAEPITSGLSITREIRRNWPDLALPIIALTCGTEELDLEQSLQSGINQHLDAAFTSDKVKLVLRRWVYRNITPSPQAGEPEPPAAIDAPRQQDSNPYKSQTTTEEASPATPNPSPLNAVLHADSASTRRKLASFCDTYNPTRVSMRQLIDMREHESAAILAHGVRSAAVYQGNSTMHLSANAVETALNTPDHQGLKKQADAFDRELQTMWRTTQQTLLRLAAEAPALKTENLLDMLERLAEQLCCDDHRAEQQADKLVGCLGTLAQHGLVTNLLNAIGETDYQAARTYLEQLRELIIARTQSSTAARKVP